MKDLELLKMFICGTRVMKDVDPKTINILDYNEDYDNILVVEYNTGDAKVKYEDFLTMDYINFLHSYIESKE